MVQYSHIVQHSNVHHSTVQHSTVQCNTIQYSTIQYSSALQYSTVQFHSLRKITELLYILHMIVLKTRTHEAEVLTCLVSDTEEAASQSILRNDTLSQNFLCHC